MRGGVGGWVGDERGVGEQERDQGQSRGGGAIEDLWVFVCWGWGCWAGQGGTWRCPVEG